MTKFSNLLGEAIASIIEIKDESDIGNFLSGGQVSFLSNEIKGLDDFELVCFVVVKDADQKPAESKDFRVVVAGSRNFSDYNKLAGKKNVTIVSGTARGADRMVEKYAAEHGIKLEQFPAEWGVYHKGAGPIRNLQMVQSANAVVAFWDNTSSGTKNIIDCARKKGIPCKVISI